MNDPKTDQTGSGPLEGHSQPVGDNEINDPTPVDDNEKPTTVTTTDSTGQTSVLQVFTDRALHFLAHASNETLGACLAGLGASTYFIFGRVGLVIIGVAGGVVLHATWEGIRGDDRDEHTKRLEQQRKKENGLELARRLLDYLERRLSRRLASTLLLLSSFLCRATWSGRDRPMPCSTLSRTPTV
jgi:hypothetical protein